MLFFRLLEYTNLIFNFIKDSLVLKTKDKLAALQISWSEK